MTLSSHNRVTLLCNKLAKIVRYRERSLTPREHQFLCRFLLRLDRRDLAGDGGDE